ncbi:MAG: deoxyribonuclease V [Chloroflexi bacterium]|nr:deoxyribonuclease V [Chloroflexota bacterium]
MKALSPHPWQVSPAQAQQIQRELAFRVVKEDRLGEVRLVAGADISRPDAQGLAAASVVVLSYPELSLVESRTIRKRVSFPYIPGLLSFRECPPVLAAWEKLEAKPDLLLVDGQGLAHPRRLGLACHLGILLGIPSIGCAKSLLCGKHGEVGPNPGDWAEVRDEEEVLGVALRTKAGVSPVYVSIGHRVSLGTAITWVKACCRGLRIPEPLRLAHQAASGRTKVPIPSL